MDYNIVEKEVIKQLKASGLIERYQCESITNTIDLDIIIEYFEKPTRIKADKFGIYIESQSEERQYIPEMLVSISSKGEWLSDGLPSINFDIEQSGIIKRAEEAEAIYITMVVAHILSDEVFKNEYFAIANNYNFITMTPRKSGDKTFLQLSNEWKELNSTIINIIISACRYKISNEKKEFEKFLKDGLTDFEVARLRDLEVIVRKIHQNYAETVLSQDNLRRITKIERLSHIQSKEDEISAEILKSKVGTLYRILNLTTEYILAIKKKKILNFVTVNVDKYFEKASKNNLSEMADRSSYIASCYKSAIKLEKMSIRRLEVEAYIKDNIQYKLPSKQ